MIKCHENIKKDRVNPFRPTLLVAPRSNWLDTIVVNLFSRPSELKYRKAMDRGYE